MIKITLGFKFGGYTEQFWINGPIKDEFAFVFSLDNKKKYNILELRLQLLFWIIAFQMVIGLAIKPIKKKKKMN